MHVNVTVTVIVVLYMLFMLYIGWASSKRIKSNSDFMVAGRRLGPILMAGTLTATEIGGGSSLGVVQNGMSGYGLSSAWYIIAIGIAFIIMSFIAPMFRKTEIKTVPEYFRRRYGKGTGLITSIVTFIPLVGLTAGQFIAAAVVLSTMLGINYKLAVIITAGVVTAYSIMGGLWSVSITDNVQMVLIIVGMAIAIPFGLRYAGGWGAVTANIPAGTLSLIGGKDGGYDIISIIGLVVMYVATFSVGQEAVSRFYAAKDEKAAKQGAILSAICNFVYAFIPAVLGIIMLALINMGKFSADDFASVGARYALPVLAAEVMPAIICGLLFAGIISATMSSSDSDLLGAGSVFANDIYKQFIDKDAAYHPDVLLHTPRSRNFLPVCCRYVLERSFHGRNHRVPDQRNRRRCPDRQCMARHDRKLQSTSVHHSGSDRRRYLLLHILEAVPAEASDNRDGSAGYRRLKTE